MKTCTHLEQEKLDAAGALEKLSIKEIKAFNT
jgi:hypothetical protein